MSKPSVNLVNVFKTFLNRESFGGVNKNQPKQKTFAEKEIETNEINEKDEKALLAKRNRVNSKWNDFKSIFGCGEKLTKAEYEKIIKIEARKTFIQDKTPNGVSDKSIWDIK